MKEKEKQRQIRISKRFIENQKKWEENVIKKIDILPPDPETHYNKRTIKPGFQFWLSLLTAPKFLLNKLDINIPDMIYVNFNAYFVRTNLETRKIEIGHAKDPSSLISSLKERVGELYDPTKHWNQPAAVMKKTSPHTCYTMSELLDWRQISHKL